MNSWKLIGLAGVLSMAATAAAQVTVYRDNVFEWVWTDHGTVGDGSEQLVAGVLSIVNNTGRADSNPQAFDSKASRFQRHHRFAVPA
ncbi:MAG: hypothetical protein CMJ49_01360 [Planctomycetaceae bacterium]|nr:hypothetical protein [Planctomycetaceae bacterium]